MTIDDIATRLDQFKFVRRLNEFANPLSRATNERIQKTELVVSRVLSPDCSGDDHLSRPNIAERLKQPTRKS